DQAVALGKEIVQKKLRDLHVKFPSEEEMLSFAQRLDRKSVEELYAHIGNGSTSIHSLAALIQPEEEKKEEPGFVGRVMERIRGAKGIRVQGLDNLMFRFAGCCQPVPGDEIVGFITRGRGVTIHQAACPLAIEIGNQYPERKISVSWDTGRDQSFVVQLELVVEDRRNMLRDITQAIADSNTNVRGAEVTTHDSTGTGKFIVEVMDLSHLNRIIDKVRKVKGVISVRRAKGREHFEQ
ncbi:MAG: ACT domain-containing protein, partial [Candidatus Zixiibacteriota bacterium]